MSPDTSAAILGLSCLGACQLAIHPLLHATPNARMPRAILGVLLALFTLATHPMTYTHCGNTLVFAPILAFLCAQAALTMLHWTLLEPMSCRPLVFDVLAAHLQHSMAGVRKAYQKRTQQQADEAGSSKEAVAEARRRVAPPWVVSVLAAGVAVLRVSLCYDVSFYLLCRATPYCDPVGSSTPFEGVRQAGERGGLVSQTAAYLRQCGPDLLAGMCMGLQLNLVCSWVVLLLCVAAFASPQLRLFCAQLPASAFDRPWATSSLRELWDRWWQQFLRFFYEGLGAKAVDGLLGMLPASWPVPAALHGGLVGAAAFGISALAHEYITWAAYGTLTGCYLACVDIQWLAVLLESAVAGQQQQHRLWTRCWAWAVCVLTAPLFFEPLRVSGFYSDHPFYPWGGAPSRLRWFPRRRLLGLGGFEDAAVSAAVTCDRLLLCPSCL